MKKITLLFAVLLASIGVYAQNALQYGFQATTGTYTELPSPTVLGTSTTNNGATSLDDVNYRVTFPADFFFDFLGASRTDVNINTNGFIGFADAIWTNSASYTPLSTNPAPTASAAGVISAYGADLNAYSATTTNPGSISWQILGTGDDQVFVVQYKNFKRFENAATVSNILNFQIHLYESSHPTKPNHIEFVYGNCVVGTAASTGIDVGIRDSAVAWAANVNSVMIANIPTGTTCNWLNVVTANNNTAGGYFNTANAAINIPNGLTYTWSPLGGAGPAMVRAFDATVPAATSATVSWTAPANATQYNVQYRKPNECTWTNWSGNPITENFVTITGLTPLTSYQVRVQASNGTLNANWSHIPNLAGTGDGYTANGTFTTLATCFAPTGVSAVTTSSGATFNWTEPATPPSQGYEYYYSQTNTAPTAGTMAMGQTFPGENIVTIGSLTPATQYYFWVRGNCGDNDKSVWTSAYSFVTDCLPSTPSAAFQDFSTFTGAMPNPACWKEATGVLGATTTLTGTTSSWTNQVFGNITGHANGTAAYVNLYGADDEWIISNAYDLGTTGSYILQYTAYVVPWTAANPPVPVTVMEDKFVRVVISTDGGLTWSDANILASYEDGNVPGTPISESISLAGYTGVVKIGFYAHSDAGDNIPDLRFFIDNFRIVPADVCLEPSNLQAAGSTENSISFTWTAPVNAPANGYDYYYSNVNTAPVAATVPTGSPFPGATDATISQLSASTTYYVWVRSKCSDNSKSAWTGPLAIATQCGISPAPFTELFSNGTQPNCFTNAASLTGATNLWKFTGAVDYATGNTRPNGTFAWVDGSSTFAPDVTLTTPVIATAGLTLPEITFDYFSNNTSTFANNIFTVQVSGTSGTWETIYTNNTSQATWRTISVQLPQYVGQNIKVRFIVDKTPAGANAFYNDILLDNVIVREAPTCFVPGLSVGTVTENSAIVTIVPPVTPPSEGYQVYYSDTNVAPTAATAPNGGTPTGTTQTLSNLTSSTNYYVYVRGNCGTINGLSEWSLAAIFKTLCDAPNILSTTPATICGQGTATISATAEAGATLSWYAAQTGGSALNTGASFTTPTVSTTTTYYVSASSGGSVTSVGPASPTAQGGTIGTQTVQWDVEFAVLVPTKLKSVDIFPNTAGGNGVISVRTTSGTVIANYPFVTTVGGGTTAQTIVLDHSFEPGNYELYTTTIPAGGIQRNTSGATYPYTSAVANILNNGFDQTYFMGMYNWQFESGCSSARQPVTVTVTTAPEITATADNTTICAGQSVNLSVSSSNANYTYLWAPGNLAGAQQTVNPSATTTYTVTATDSSTNCVTTATVVVTVNQLPNAISVTPSAAQVCGTTPVALTATGSTASGNAVLGTGSVTPTATGVPNPLTGYYGGQWTQMLYKKAELEAQGMVAGSVINTLAFDLSAAQADLVEEFTIRIGHSNVEDMSAGFVPVAPLTTVYYEAQMTPAEGVTGLKVFTLTTPFTWNGNSNLIVEVVHNQGTSGTTSGTITRATTTPFVSVYYLRVDNVAGGVTGFQTQDYSAITTKGALSNRPNIVLNYNYSNNVTWSPVTGLYTDSAATTPYTGQAATTVYALPAVNTTYVATSTNVSNCTVTDDAVVTIGASNTPTGATSQVISVNAPEEATIEDIVVAETGVIWYSSLANAVAGINPLPAGTVLDEGATYYGTLSTGSCVPLEVTITQILGSKGFNKSQFSYYPNPVKDMLNLKYSNEISGVEVYNLLGQKVLAKQVNATEATVDMSGIAEGSYIVKVTSGDNTESIKIVKKQ